MNTTLSTRQIRLVGLLVLVAVLGGGFLVVTRHKSTAPTTASSTPAATTPAQTTHTQTTPAPSKAHSHTATPTKLSTHGLPVPVAQALRKHSIVVVALYMPGASVDASASAEAQAGAHAMHAGFVKVDVLHQATGVAILRKIGVTNTPVILVVKRPAIITSDFKGFIDRNVVVQAVADAR
jgi:hypothetical protein